MNEKNIQVKKEQGKRLKISRNSIGITQKAFGSPCGLKASMIKDRESGVVNISDLEAKAFEDKHNVNSCWLISGIGEMFISTPPVISESRPQYVNKNQSTLPPMSNLYPYLLDNESLCQNLEYILSSGETAAIDALKYGIEGVLIRLRDGSEQTQLQRELVNIMRGMAADSKELLAGNKTIIGKIDEVVAASLQIDDSQGEEKSAAGGS